MRMFFFYSNQETYRAFYLSLFILVATVCCRNELDVLDVIFNTEPKDGQPGDKK